MNEPNKIKFLNWEAASRDTIDVKRIYIDMSEDLASGIMLSQIVYWHLPSRRSGNSKLRIERDGEFWIAKTFDDWMYECRLSKKQARRAAEHLTELGLIVTKVYHFANKPSTHIRLNWGVFTDRFSYIVNYVNTPEEVAEHWRTINAKDGRSASRMVENIVNDQKGILQTKIPLSNVTHEVEYQKGTLQSDKKESTCTKSTAEITPSENSSLAKSQETDKGNLIVVPSFPSVDIKTLNSSDETYNAFGYLIEYALYAEELRQNITAESIAEFKLNCTKDKHIRRNCTLCKPAMKNCSTHLKPCECLTPQEIPSYKLLLEAINILTSGSADFAKESMEMSKFVRKLHILKYPIPTIIGCIAYAYKRGKYDVFPMTISNLPKLMPEFLDKVRTGELKDSIQLGKSLYQSTNDRNWRKLQNNKEEIINNAAKASQEFAAKHGITARPKI